MKGKADAPDVSFWDQRASQISSARFYECHDSFVHRLEGVYCRKEDSKFMAGLLAQIFPFRDIDLGA